MEIIDKIQNYLPLITFFGAGLAWLIRLESLSMANKKEIYDLKIDKKNSDDNSDSFREKILVKLEGLETSNKFILEALQELKVKNK